jgi:3'-phosphoadenosine 5'-phosphosulfate sulfotransferase (PAPS reductase)/FAD synthetase
MYKKVYFSDAKKKLASIILLYYYAIILLCDILSEVVMEDFDIPAKAKNVFMVEPRPLLSFSLGVDSIAMWLRIKELANNDSSIDIENSVFFYMYFIPGLPFVDDYIDYFENHEKVKIIQVPHNVFLQALANWHWQPPIKSYAVELLQRSQNRYVQMKKEDIENYIKIKTGIPAEAYTCVGVKAGDSAMRRMAMRKTQGINESKLKFYPIADYENSDVYSIIKKHGVKVPIDYRLFGISYENLQYRFAKNISEKCPESWRICKEWFPDIELSLARYEHYHPEWCGDNMIKGRKGKIFNDMILDPRRPL